MCRTAPSEKAARNGPQGCVHGRFADAAVTHEFRGRNAAVCIRAARDFRTTRPDTRLRRIQFVFYSKCHHGFFSPTLFFIVFATIVFDGRKDARARARACSLVYYNGRDDDTSGGDSVHDEGRDVFGRGEDDDDDVRPHVVLTSRVPDTCCSPELFRGRSPRRCRPQPRQRPPRPRHVIVPQ